MEAASPSFPPLSASYWEEGTTLNLMPMLHSMPMFGFVDVILVGIIALIILIAGLMTLPELVRYIRMSSM
jgi:hypothetical protein